MDVAADEPKVKAMIKSMLEEFPNDLLLFSQLYTDITPGEETYGDKVCAAALLKLFTVSCVSTGLCGLEKVKQLTYTTTTMGFANSWHVCG